ncbi:MAG: hypothetical protein HOV81_33700 [Kofleriaceae bacterium]|nr:hypothetical protein [Kofleriaceae bacterium]
MQGLVERARRDPGGVMLVAALLVAAALYAPTLSRGLINYDDPWLVGENWMLQHPSPSTLHSIFFDLHSPQRFLLLGAEYLPVRDLSIMGDFAIWGDWYPGFHITNLVLYLAAIGLWFAALTRFGIDRKLVGIAILLWALHPAHAESVAWITERKGLLGLAFAGTCALGYARFRRGGGVGYLALAMLAAVCAVWSKAPAAFAVGALAGLELVLPRSRVSWRRSLVGLVAIGTVAAAAFVPVVLLARANAIVGTETPLPVGRIELVLGVHGFYLRSAAMAIRNAVSYPLSIHGPSAFDIALGVCGLALLVALAVVPRRGRWKPPEAIRVGAILWLFGWLPVSYLVLPLQRMFVADRYLLFPTLGTSLVVAAGIVRLTRPSIRRALIAAIALAAMLRSLDAQSSWSSPRNLWARAVESNPDDGNAWAMYVESLAGDREKAEAALAEALHHSNNPRLLMRQALSVLDSDRTRGIELMRRAAEGGEPIAMSNLALLLLADGAQEEALSWARRGAVLRPNAHAQRTLGKVALAMHHGDEALSAFGRALDLEPTCANRFNFALALVELDRRAEARPHLEACASDPVLGIRIRQLRDSLSP